MKLVSYKKIKYKINTTKNLSIPYSQKIIFSSIKYLENDKIKILTFS